MRSTVGRWRRLARRLEPWAPGPPVPPPLPPGRVVAVPDRGEVFVREVAGPGPTIVLLHGWTSTADLTWWRVYESLGRLGHVVAVDHRGHGRGIRSHERFTLEDAADDVAGLLRLLGRERAVVCGYSMGAPVSMLLRDRHPDLVAGLVLEATALEWRSDWGDRLVWRSMGIVERAFRSTFSTSIVDRLLREVLERCEPLAEHRDWLRGELRRGDPTAIAEAGRAIGRYDGRPLAAAIDIPASVVVTTDDHLVRPSKQRALAAAIRGAERFELDADHDACLTSVDGFARATVAAVESVLARLG